MKDTTDALLTGIAIGAISTVVIGSLWAIAIKSHGDSFNRAAWDALGTRTTNANGSITTYMTNESPELLEATSPTKLSS